jgi:hypothetical protein
MKRGDTQFLHLLPVGREGRRGGEQGGVFLCGSGIVIGFAPGREW